MPVQDATSKPARPLSWKVGTSGSALERLALGTPSAMSRSVRTYCCALAIAVKTSGIWPPTTSIIAWPPPL